MGGFRVISEKGKDCGIVVPARWQEASGDVIHGEYFTLAVIIIRLSNKPDIRGLVFGLAALTTLLIGFSRIYLGVHWPTDILSGWAAGLVWVAVWTQLTRPAKQMQ